MHDRSLKLDFVALLLLAVVVFLGLSLATYDGADPLPVWPAPLGSLYQSDALVYPPHARPHNLCGQSGAIVADLLFNALGWGAYFVVASLAVLDVTLLRRQRINLPVIRSVGWVASIAGVSTLAAMCPPWFTVGPVLGPGGALGLMGRTFLEQHFATAGGMIVAGSCLAGGLLLATDYAIVKFALWCFNASLATARGGKKLLSGGKSAANTAKPALKLVGGEASDKHGAPVKIKGKKLNDLDVVTTKSGKKPRAAEAAVDEERPATISIKERLATKAALLGTTDDEDEEELEDDHEVASHESDDDAAEPHELDYDTAVANVKGAAPADGSAARVKINGAKQKDEHREVIAQLEAASRGDQTPEYQLPSLELLLQSEDIDFEAQAQEVRRKAKVLEKTFADFGFQVKVVEIETGPVIAQYEVELEAGLRLSKITGLAEDLAIALRVPSVRIVAPIPGKNTVGIEVPNEERQIVRLREVMEEANAKVKKMRIPLFLGKDVSGNALVADLSSLPHLLIAGRTGTGKSVCLNAIICSLLMTRRPDEVRLLMIDPKMVELSGYGTLPHLMHPVVTDMRKAEAILAWGVEKMEERYALLARAGVRHISNYNQLGEEELMERLQPESEDDRQNIPLHLPYIVIVADELADLMMTSGKEVEQHIIRLAQKSRAVGIHLILATQKPTVDVITGLIKSNLPARIAFQVASRTDSRVVLDEMGADKLLGNGDMLFLWPGTSTLLRGQGTYVSDDEINAIVDAVSTGEQDFVTELVQLKPKAAEGEAGESEPGSLRKRDDLYDEAVEVVIREGRGSVSLLQRALGIGYGRAARLVDFMAEDGIVGTYAGSQAREVLITMDDFRRLRGGGEADEEAPVKPKRSNKIVPVSPPDADDFGPDDDAHEDSASRDTHDGVYDDPPFDADDDSPHADNPSTKFRKSS